MSKMVWQKTKKQFLLRDKISGRYYCRFFADGKQHWYSLKTTVFAVAEAKLSEKLKEFKKANKTSQTVEQGKATVKQLAQIYLASQKLRPDIKASTVHYRQQCITAILKTWPELATARPKDVSETDCQAWAKRLSEAYSPTRYNNTIDTLRGIFETGISRGLIYRNPAAELGKRKPSSKHLEVPTSEEVATVVKSVRKEGAWCSKQCGDLIEFLAFTGCRITEANNIRWDDVKADGIWIHGGESGTKNKESRFLPMNPRLESLIADLRANPRYRRSERGDEYLLAVSECQKAIDSACQRLNAKAKDSGLAAIKRFTHHDLRHLFCTRAIESGIDIPTVARWAGHSDGGTLLMKTYSHLLKEHSQRMAAKLSF
jgi:integrase